MPGIEVNMSDGRMGDLRRSSTEDREREGWRFICEERTDGTVRAFG